MNKKPKNELTLPGGSSNESELDELTSLIIHDIKGIQQLQAHQNRLITEVLKNMKRLSGRANLAMDSSKPA